MMQEIYVVAHIQIQPGRASEFEQYEAEVLPIIKEFGGSLLYRLRRSVHGDPAPDSDTDSGEEVYEIHLLQFSDYAAFERYRSSPSLAALAAKREAAIAKTHIQVCTAISTPS